MHVQPVDLQRETVICPKCQVLQNVDVASHDEESDLMSGQLCWYCGYELRQDELSDSGEFKVVLSGSDVPSAAEAIAAWEQELERDFGGKPTGFSFDAAGRCVVTMHPVATTDDLDVPVE